MSEVEADHYAYCHSSVCPGCLPSDAELQAAPMIVVWGEMLARCISQTPQTKTHAGALAAVRAEDTKYRTMAREVRAREGWLTEDGQWGRKPGSWTTATAQ